jgi:hypothetical protein
MTLIHNRKPAQKKLTRRDFLLMAGAGAAAAIGIPIAGKFISAARKKELQRVWNEKLKEHHTGGKKGNVIRMVESTPDVADLEMGWVKFKPGYIKEAATRRGLQSTILHPNSASAKSDIHTHRLKSYPKGSKFEGLSRINAYPSPGDILDLVIYFRKNKLRRTTHVITVDEQGKVLGSSAMRISKKLEAALNDAETQKIVKMAEDIGEKIQRLDASENQSEWKPLATEICDDHLKYLSYLKDKGLQFKRVPIKGYFAKDGEFIKKAP